MRASIVVIIGLVLGACSSGGTAGAQVAQEITDLQTSVTALQGQVTTLQTALTAETTRATAAEAALTTQLGTLETGGIATTTRLALLEAKTASLSAATVAGQPAAIFSGVNLYVQNGMGKTGTSNAVGNLIVGYDEASSANVRTGSHNLVLGTQNDYSSWGGFIAGENGSIFGQYSAVLGGTGLTASARDSSVGPHDGATATQLTSLTQALSDETTRAETVEKTLATSVTNNNTTVTAAIEAEATRAGNAEATNSAAASAEATRARSAEQALTANLATTNVTLATTNTNLATTNTTLTNDVATLTTSLGSGGDALAATQTEVTALQAVTSSMSTATDATGSAAVYFKGVNVYVQNGAGSTDTTNGAGNLVVGYNEVPNTVSRGGSHNLVLGTQNNYSSYGGLVAGGQNSISAQYATVVGGTSLTEATNYGSIGPNDATYASGLSTLTTNLASTNTVANNAAAGVATLTTSLATTNTSLAATNTVANNAVAGVASLTTSLATTNTSLAATSAAATNAAASVSTLNTSLSATNTNLAAANTTLATTNSNLTTTNSNVASLTISVNGLATTSVKSGMVSYFNATSCPSGWSGVATAQGRYIVGLQASGTLAATVGAALANAESRQVPAHAHTTFDPGHVHFVESAPVDDRNFTGTTQAGQQYGVVADAGGYNNGNPSGLAPGVNTVGAVTNLTVMADGDYTASNLAAPYVQFLVCQKN